MKQYEKLTKTLFIEKRGSNFFNDTEAKLCSDLENYRLVFRFTGKDGTEENIQAMLPDKLPSDIQKLYDASHE